MMNKYILSFLIFQCVLYDIKAQKSYQELFCSGYNQEDSFCIFSIPVALGHKDIKIQPNIFDDLEQHFTISGRSDQGKYKITIQIVAFNRKVFFDSLKIDNCEDKLHTMQITSIFRSSCLRFIDDNFEYLESYYNYPNRSIFIFHLTPK